LGIERDWQFSGILVGRGGRGGDGFDPERWKEPFGSGRKETLEKALTKKSAVIFTWQK